MENPENRVHGGRFSTWYIRNQRTRIDSPIDLEQDLWCYVPCKLAKWMRNSAYQCWEIKASKVLQGNGLSQQKRRMKEWAVLLSPVQSATLWLLCWLADTYYKGQLGASRTEWVEEWAGEVVDWGEKRERGSAQRWDEWEGIVGLRHTDTQTYRGLCRQIAKRTEKWLWIRSDKATHYCVNPISQSITQTISIVNHFDSWSLRGNSQKEWSVESTSL